MNSTRTNNIDNNNMIIITFFIQAIPYHQLPSLLKKCDAAYVLLLKSMRRKINYWFCLSTKISTDYCLADLSLGAVLNLGARSQNSTAVFTVENLSSVFFVFNIVCVLK